MVIMTRHSLVLPWPADLPTFWLMNFCLYCADYSKIEKRLSETIFSHFILFYCIVSHSYFAFPPFLTPLRSAGLSYLRWTRHPSHAMSLQKSPESGRGTALSLHVSKHIVYRTLQCHWHCKHSPEEKHLHVHHWESGWSGINRYGIMILKLAGMDLLISSKSWKEPHLPRIYIPFKAFF